MTLQFFFWIGSTSFNQNAKYLQETLHFFGRMLWTPLETWSHRLKLACNVIKQNIFHIKTYEYNEARTGHIFQDAVLLKTLRILRWWWYFLNVPWPRLSLSLKISAPRRLVKILIWNLNLIVSNSKEGSASGWQLHQRQVHQSHLTQKVTFRKIQLL